VRKTNVFNTSIRRALVLSGLVLGAATLVAPKAMADTVPLQGVVTSTLAWTSTPTAGAGTLSLGSATQRIVQVADIAIATNNEQGYTLTVTSGNLTKTNGTSIAYQVATTNDGTAAVAGDFGVASGTDYTFTTVAANASGTNGRDLSIMYTPAALQDPGTYAGTITVTVADN
jgi:hypothetical protein